MTCAACGTENREGRRFCAECGAQLAEACAACGAANEPGEKFCGECGKPLAAAAQAARREGGGPAAERRLVSVLFVDLVGFTTASEGRDSEDTRELLTAYFDLARTTIERYGGTVEKFIGDAVMALWGAPVAQEDDAERAVRAALELTAAVPGLHPALQARAGVLTGEAAVTLGATDQGMVAGDLVNTASRIQSAAETGSVLAGDATRRASDASVAYEDGGLHELKGKAEPVQLWRALRVVAARRGEGRAAGFEAPFVGRERELRLVKELFHATADEGRAHLLSVVGVAGIGKSRLAWEFEKYLDGLVGSAWWHRGRCLAYGEGVSYWALAEMIRMRARIAEDDAPEDALRKLAEVVAQIVPDEEERTFVEPRLQHLLGLTERVAPDREDLFSAWRLFVERMADQNPVIMVFEDIQWADAALVEFVEYLLDWSRSHPIYLVMLARPEVSERHPGWGAGLRNFTTLSLEPLADEAIEALLRGLVPGLPDDAVARIQERADGIPLYAVETVRMLVDRGLLELAEGGYRATTDLSSLDVPETLQALVAARLDGLEPAERRLLQDAAVLGMTFAAPGPAALGDTTEDAIRPTLNALVRKELLVLDTDPRSPERGQYGFVQALVQRIAYETLSRRDRKAKHLAAAAYLSGEAGVDPDEIAEVIAAHLLDAQRAEPDDADAEAIKADARAWLIRAGERSASLAASLEAQRAFVQAAELASERVERGRSLARAGDLAVSGGRVDEGAPLLEEAIEILRDAGELGDAARAEVRLGELFLVSNRIEEGVELLERALSAHEQEGDEGAVAAVSAELARLLYFEGRSAEALPHVERALEVSEQLRHTDVIVQALITKALIVEGRPNECFGMVRQALLLAEESGDDRGAMRACMNLSYMLSLAGRLHEAEQVVERGLAHARRRGDRARERGLTTNLVSTYVSTGRWDDAERVVDELPEEGRISANPVEASMMLDLAIVALHRGDTERARELAIEYTDWQETAHEQAAGVRIWARVVVAQAEARHEDVLADCVDALNEPAHRRSPVAVEVLLVHGAESAFQTRSADALATLIALAEDAPIERPPGLDALLTLQRARLAALHGEPEPRYEAAVAALREVEDPFWTACALLEQAEQLVEQGRGDEAGPLADEARETFERLRVAPKLERVARVKARSSPSDTAVPAA